MPFQQNEINALQGVAHYAWDTKGDPNGKVNVRIIVGKDDAGQGMPKDQPSREAVLKDSFHTLQQIDAADNANNTKQPQHSRTWRANTKWRVITTGCLIFGDKEGLFTKQGTPQSSPLPVIVTTGCAPNFMGARPNADGSTTGLVDLADRPDLNSERYGSKPDAQQKITIKLNDNYLKDMTLLITAWLEEQDAAGVETVLMPFVGGGVYLNNVNNRDEARVEIQKAIENAIEGFFKSSNRKHVQNVLVSHYEGTNPRTDQYTQTSKRDNKGVLQPFQTLMNGGDLFRTLRFCREKNLSGGEFGNLGIINAGSDRSIGGNCKFTVTNGGGLKDDFDVKDIDHLPFEEQLARRSTLLQQQSIELNKANIEKATQIALGAKVVTPTATNVAGGTSQHVRHQNIDALLEVYKTLDFAARKKFVGDVMMNGGVVAVGAGNYYHAGPAVAETVADDQIDNWLLKKINTEFTDYEKIKDSTSDKLNVYKLVIPFLGKQIFPVDHDFKGTAIAQPEGANEALSWLHSRAKAKRVVTAMELIKHHKIDQTKLPADTQTKLTAAVGKKLVVMTCVPDYIADPKKPTETTQLVKVYNGDNDNPVFKDNRELADALNAANIDLDIGGVICRISGKVEQGMVAFYRTPGNPDKNQTTMISTDDIQFFGGKNISEAVMVKLNAELGKKNIVVQIESSAPRPKLKK